MKKDPLFSFIKSLDTGEKRYFKRFAQFHIERDRNKYIRLFELMDAREVYDEKDVKAAFSAGDSFIKNLSFNKNYLFQLIQKSLRNYHNHRSARIRFFEMMIDIAVMTEKGQPEAALTLIRKARKKAAARQLYSLEMDLAVQERKIIRQFSSHETEEELRRIDEYCRSSLHHQLTELDIARQYEQVFLMARNKNAATPALGSMEQEMERLIAGQKKDGNLSFESVAYFHLLKVQSTRLLKEHEASNGHLLALLNHFEAFPDLLKETEYQTRYLNVLNNYFNNCFLLGNKAKCLEVLEKMKTFEPSNEKMKAAFFDNYHFCKMVYHLNAAEYKEAIKLVADIEKGFKKYRSNIPKGRELGFRYNIALSYYMDRQPEQALDWVNSIVADPRQEVREDIQILARIFQIALQYEFGNEYLAGNLIASYRQTLKKHRKPESPEWKIIETLRLVIKQDNRSLLQGLKKDLEKENGWEEFKEWIDRMIGRTR